MSYPISVADGYKDVVKRILKKKPHLKSVAKTVEYCLNKEDDRLEEVSSDE